MAAPYPVCETRVKMRTAILVTFLKGLVTNVVKLMSLIALLQPDCLCVTV